MIANLAANTKTPKKTLPTDWSYRFLLQLPVVRGFAESREGSAGLTVAHRFLN